MRDLTLDEATRLSIRSANPLLWLNPSLGNKQTAPAPIDSKEMLEAEARLKRFAQALIELFPELLESDGIIESALLPAQSLEQTRNPIGGKLWLKADHTLPVAGSIKARGGIHEVLCFAEALALEHGIINNTEDDYQKLLSEPARKLFADYTVAVGSTGNLGLSIGIIGAALGFKATVHMSSDAKDWKKQRLRDRSVTVIEHDNDYGEAVAAGRAAAEADPKAYFVDDENSSKLFMGYAVAALRLQKQLHQLNVKVDAQHPLFVYLPAGVGGAPGGIAYGLKQCFGENVHCFFAEPTQAPCMLLGYATKAGCEPTPIYDLDLKIDTEADGLAVGTAAHWVCDATRDLISGVYTAADAQLFDALKDLFKHQNIEVEPSSAIACIGPEMLATEAGRSYLKQHKLEPYLLQSNHIAWLTGGSFVPAEEHARYRLK